MIHQVEKTVELLNGREETKRDLWFDLIRGICIISVVLGHVMAHDDRLRFPVNVIYSFHMPVLFWISAYLEERQFREKGRTPFAVMGKRIRSLLIPFWIWLLIGYVIKALSSYRTTGIAEFDPIELVSGLLGMNGSGPWFLFVLFELKMLHCLYRKFWKEQWGILGSGFVMAGLIVVTAAIAFLSGHVLLRNSLSYSIPYYLGIVMAQFPQISEFLWKKVVVLLAGLCYLGLFCFFDSNSVNWSNQVIRIALSLCVIVALWFGRKNLESVGKLPSYFTWVGRNSIAIYLIHGNFQVLATTIVAAVPYAFAAFIAAVVIAFIQATLWSFVKQILDRYLKPLSKVLFGG